MESKYKVNILSPCYLCYLIFQLLFHKIIVGTNKKMVNLNAIKSTIMANKGFFKKYKSCVIVAPVMIINLNDQFISFQNELVKKWNSLFPDVAKFKIEELYCVNQSTDHI
ncbi:hypothetical protein [Pedobacter sp. AJM]|jgi:hypothetical protein|uniref:hypothetical protein n=1 Tax=Pedobacter sp. AJM TaxID=2003629 RepID=UPI000B4C171E|nr:hypothetical protein [Pedobacter sp. AJM]OWK71177.1 hypothetical protein CBW18_08890 [Pedobacter sp. AJM]